MMVRRLVFFSLSLIGCLVNCVAEEAPRETEEIRPVYSAYMLEAGSAHLAETYLSPLHYDGWTLGIAHQRAQAMRFSPERWLMELGGRVNVDRTLVRPARNSAEWAASLELSWAMLHKWRLPSSLTLYAGGFTRLDAGVYYVARNGNNPVAAKASWTVGPKVAIGWRTLLFKKIPVRLHYSLEMPLTGIFFSPEYGELYYEIFLGNHRGLVHGAWPGNYLRLDNELIADITFGKTVLRLGYAPRIFSSKASGIVTRRVSHGFILGVAQEWTSLRSDKLKTESQRIISAY